MSQIGQQPIIPVLGGSSPTVGETMGNIGKDISNFGQTVNLMGQSNLAKQGKAPPLTPEQEQRVGGLTKNVASLAMGATTAPETAAADLAQPAVDIGQKMGAQIRRGGVEPQTGTEFGNVAEAGKVNEVWNKYGIATAKDAENKVSDLYNQAKTAIQNDITNNPNFPRVKISDLHDAIEENIKNTFGLDKIPKNISKQVARLTSQLYTGGETATVPIKDAAGNVLNTIRTGEFTPLGQQVPDHFTGSDLLNLNARANQSAKGALAKLSSPNASPLTDKEMASVAYRNVINDALKGMYPQLSTTFEDMKNLMSSASSGGLAQVGKVAKGVRGIPGEIVNLVRQGAGQMLQRTPIGTALDIAGAAGLGAAGMKFGPDLVSQVTQKVGAQQYGKDGQPIDQGHNNIVGGASSKYQTPTLPQGFIDPNSAANQISQLQQKIGQESVTNPIQAAQDKGTLDALNTQVTKQQPVTQEWQKLGVINSAAQQLTNAINSADPNLFNSVGWINKLATEQNGAYADLATRLQVFAKLAGIDLSTIKGAGALLNAVDGAASSELTTYNTMVEQYSGGTAPTVTSQGTQSPQPQATPTTITPQNNAVIPSNFTFGRAGQGMPLPQFPTQ